MTSSGPIPGTGCALRRVVVATDLAALRGPLNGRWQLPMHLDASARAAFDFADPDEREEAYQLVLLEAASPADLQQWLDGTERLRMWPHLYLPRVVRAAWQAEQPALARIGARPRVAQPALATTPAASPSLSRKVTSAADRLSCP